MVRFDPGGRVCHLCRSLTVSRGMQNRSASTTARVALRPMRSAGESMILKSLTSGGSTISAGRRATSSARIRKNIFRTISLFLPSDRRKRLQRSRTSGPTISTLWRRHEDARSVDDCSSVMLFRSATWTTRYEPTTAPHTWPTSLTDTTICRNSQFSCMQMLPRPRLLVTLCACSAS